jgi:hypothetical protein
MLAPAMTSAASSLRDRLAGSNPFGGGGGGGSRDDHPMDGIERINT